MVLSDAGTLIILRYFVIESTFPKLRTLEKFNPTLDEVQDNLIGTAGIPERDRFEYKFMIGKAIRETRKEQHISQEELGKLIDVKKAQISCFENNASYVIIVTVFRVFTALNAKVTFHVNMFDIVISSGK